MSPEAENSSAISAAASPAEAAGTVALPPDGKIILPVRNDVLFPGIVIPNSIGRQASIAAAQQAVRQERPIGVVLQRKADVEEPGPEDLHRIGTIANIVHSAVDSARAHNGRQDLSAVEVGAHDEIYQSQEPVLVGVCAHSSYCYLLSQERHRDADTWGCVCWS